ncbi:MAG: DUF4197 domain-containing protein [Bacteroidales bacterium]|nr:DUF4197 domain-containing protein [Bacteroidales bacterium]
MRIIKKTLLVFMLFTLIQSCDILKELELPESTGSAGLTEEQVANGLKQALEIGTKNAVQELSRENAIYGNPSRRIPFPQEAQIVEEKLRQYGMGNMVDKFIKEMNHGAEEAMSKAKPVFVNAIKKMTIQDAWNILKGPDDAATQYFKNKTSDELYMLFKPKMKSTLDDMNVTNLWSSVMSTYNKLPFEQKVNADLPDYLTNMAIDRLFNVIAREELKIREDPVARVTDLLKKVFSQQ